MHCFSQRKQVLPGACCILTTVLSFLIQAGVVKAPLAYVMARNDPEMTRFINSWINLKKKDNTIDRLYDYWILGKNAKAKQPRWSVVRNVLHWVK